jgi:hypothetical protein
MKAKIATHVVKAEEVAITTPAMNVDVAKKINFR